MAARAGRDGTCSSCLAHVVEWEAMDGLCSEEE
jgi:hypothetical protein